MYTHTPRRVQSSRTARLDALAIAVGCDSRRDKATDPETYIIHVSYDFAYNWSNCGDATLARLWTKVLDVFHETRRNVRIWRKKKVRVTTWRLRTRSRKFRVVLIPFVKLLRYREAVPITWHSCLSIWVSWNKRLTGATEGTKFFHTREVLLHVTAVCAWSLRALPAREILLTRGTPRKFIVV